MDKVTCTYCGVVQRGHNCPNRSRKKKDSQANKFRHTTRWSRKSVEIRQRDRYLCVVCEAGLYDTIINYNYHNLSVHHIVPIEEDYNKRLDNDNLITLCDYHHKKAEEGKIPREILIKLTRK